MAEGDGSEIETGSFDIGPSPVLGQEFSASEHQVQYPSQVDEGPVTIEPKLGLGRRDPVIVRLEAEIGKWLAYGLLAIFLAAVVAVVVMAFHSDLTNAGELAKTVLPVTGGPLAVALGYYFGASQ